MVTDDLFDDLALPTEVVAPLQRRELSGTELVLSKIKNLEDSLLIDSLEVVTSVCKFAEFDPKVEYDPKNLEAGPPQEWLDELGEKEAGRKYRMVMAGWENSKAAPVAISVATKVSVGIIRARASSKMAPRTLNLQVIQMTAPRQDYERIRIEE